MLYKYYKNFIIKLYIQQNIQKHLEMIFVSWESA